VAVALAKKGGVPGVPREEKKGEMHALHLGGEERNLHVKVKKTTSSNGSGGYSYVFMGQKVTSAKKPGKRVLSFIV